jgi:SAM-dependent methyltransferase
MPFEQELDARPSRRPRSATGQQAWADSLFVAPAGAGSAPVARLRLVDGGHLPLDVARWHREPTAADRDVLARSSGPVIDIGCGPGRIVDALVADGHDALGIDSSAAAVTATRRRGAPAVRASVWGPVPRAGAWGTALLLDGNIGIGGDPVPLLRRVAELLADAGRIIVELSSGPPAGSHIVRVEHPGGAGPWFAWAVVTPASIGDVADAAGLRVDDIWEADHRWFALLSMEDDATRSTADGPAA